MIYSLENICSQKIIELNINNLGNKLNYSCYLKVIENIRKKYLEKWQNDILIVNLELLIEEIDIHYDMSLGDLIVVIEIKNKNSEEILNIYPYFDEPIYSYYYYIVKKRNIIENSLMDI